MEPKDEVARLRSRMTELEADSQMFEQRYRAVLEIIAILDEDVPVEEMVRRTGAIMQRLIPGDRFSLRLFWLNRWYSLEGDAFSAEEVDGSVSMAEDASGTHWAALNRKPLLRRDIAAEQRFALDGDLVAEGMRADLIVPLVVDGRGIGTFNFTSCTPDFYQESHLQMAQSLVDAVAVVVKQLQIFQKLEEAIASRTYGLQRQTDLQEGLLYISRAVQQLQRPNDLEQLMQILDEQLRKLGLDFSTLAIHRLKSEQPPVFESYEVQEGGKINRRVKTHGFLQRIWAAGETIYRPDLEADPMDFSPPEYERLCKRYGMRIRSMLDVPYARGVLALLSGRKGVLSAAEIRFVEQICGILTLGILRVEDLEAIQASSQALQESEERFRRLAEATCEGIVISEQGKILDVNRQLAEMHGFVPDELIGREVIELVAPEWRDRVRQRIISGSEEVYEPMGLRKDGSTFPAEVHARIVTRGERRLRVTAMRDITERRKAMERQIHLERLGALGEMAQGVAHNFNNLMVGVLGYAQLIQLETGDEKVLKDARQIVRGAERAKELVQRLNLAVRSGSEKVAPVQVGSVVERAIEAARPRWKDETESKGIRIEVITRIEDTPPISANRTRLHDILINLIFNAVDAMPEGGTISMEARAADGMVELEVRDTGVGMDEETRRRVFEPFFTTKAAVGTGLSLSGAYNTVIQWNGTIEVHSTPGEGTAVIMRFPAAEEVKDEKKEREASASEAISGGRILVVDDDEIVVTFLDDLLSIEHVVETVSNGREALDRFAPGRYEVALIDLGMPGMPGDQVARVMKEADGIIVTVLVTGWELEEDDLRLVPFDFLLLKPFTFKAVEETVGQALALQARRRAGDA